MRRKDAIIAEMFRASYFLDEARVKRKIAEVVCTGLRRI